MTGPVPHLSSLPASHHHHATHHHAMTLPANVGGSPGLRSHKGGSRGRSGLSSSYHHMTGVTGVLPPSAVSSSYRPVPPYRTSHPAPGIQFHVFSVDCQILPGLQTGSHMPPTRQVGPTAGPTDRRIRGPASRLTWVPESVRVLTHGLRCQRWQHILPFLPSTLLPPIIITIIITGIITAHSGPRTVRPAAQFPPSDQFRLSLAWTPSQTDATGALDREAVITTPATSRVCLRMHAFDSSQAAAAVVSVTK